MMRILLVDTDPERRRALNAQLLAAGHRVAVAPEAGAPAVGGAEPFDAIFCELSADRATLMGFLDPSGIGGPPVIGIAGPDAAGPAPEGLYDLVRVPVGAEELGRVLRRVEERQRDRRELEQLRAAVAREGRASAIAADGSVMQQAVAVAQRAAGGSGPVLLVGERGTGKSLLARYIHQRGARAGGPFVVIACAALAGTASERPGTGGESGPVGAFAAAGGGTLYLDDVDALGPTWIDEVGNLVSGERPERPRLIGAVAVAPDTTSGVVQLFPVAETIRIDLPPLRDRKEEIAGLAAQFLASAAARLERPLTLTPPALHHLTRYGWPGNVQELRTAIERAAVLARGTTLVPSDFRLGVDAPAPAGSEGLKAQVEELERQAIARALGAAGGNRRAAAKALGVSLRTLFYKMGRYGLR